jgi:hypothetical protein
MYDKYFKVNPITPDGSQFPKHKGVLVNNTSTTAAGITFYVRNNTGNTMTALFTFPQGNNILSVEVYGIPTGGLGGLTAFIVN